MQRLLISFSSLAISASVIIASGNCALALSPADVPTANNQALRSKAEQLFALGNQARAAQGVAPLSWDQALAAAAMNHCTRVAAEGQLSHQYSGELELTQRAAQAGAHFSYIEENVAAGYATDSLHQAWMHSQGHRENLLNPQVNRVGIAVVARGDMLYAVAVFGRAVEVLTPDQVEAKVSNLMQSTGVAAHGSSEGARLACAQDHGLPVSLDNRRPEFIMRWQDAGLERLPGALLDRIATGRYRDAAVGSCPSQNPETTFTVYRVAVLLLRPEPAAPRTMISSSR
jgi:uncharacterized protein YkwD